MKDITTIKTKKQTKVRLERLKEYERETYDQVLRKMLYILNRVRKDPISANRLLSRIDKNTKKKMRYTNPKEEIEVEKKIPEIKEKEK